MEVPVGDADERPIEIAEHPIEIETPAPDPVWHRRLRAIIEILLCSGVPTQVAIAQLLALGGLRPLSPSGALEPSWVFLVAFIDTFLLITLAFFLLRANGESPRAVFLGSRSPLREAVFGLALIGPLILGVAGIMVAARVIWPSLHNVAENPLGGLLRSPLNAALFAVVAIVGGGVREELQRAFLLTRFERDLGGPVVGLVVTSVAFGAGHALQGWDAAVATGAMGFFWGWLYLRRRSVVASMASHAGYNSLEIVRFIFMGPGA
jgi:membrane protease YdiL (CAAX protease family)